MSKPCCSSAGTFCTELLAIVSVEMRALTRIWARDNREVPVEKSVSQMVL